MIKRDKLGRFMSTKVKKSVKAPAKTKTATKKVAAKTKTATKSSSKTTKCCGKCASKKCAK